jgi:hypothetical protein
MKKVLYWVLAFILTAGTSVYQRITGPTNPLRVKAELNGKKIASKLPRSHVTGENCEIRIKELEPEIEGYVTFKRFKTNDSLTRLPMEREEDSLVAYLPFEPPAGKLEYNVNLREGSEEVTLSGENPVVIRFKGKVPAFILWPHIFVMFFTMLFAMRTGIEALRPNSNPRKLAVWTTGFLIAGGMVLGPLVQKFAFGKFWTGFPLGTDLTDNKTLIAVIAWIVALIAGRGGKPARGWVLGAVIVLLAVYFIPHSLFGSELDYSKENTQSSHMVFPHKAYPDSKYHLNRLFVDKQGFVSPLPYCFNRSLV